MQRYAALLMALSLAAIISACGGSDKSNAPIKPFSPVKKPELPTQMSFSDGLINMEQKIIDTMRNKKVSARNLLATKDATKFIAKLDFGSYYKYYLLDTANKTLKAEDEIKLNALVGLAENASNAHVTEFITPDNRLAVFDGSNKKIYLMPVKSTLKKSEVQSITLPADTNTFNKLKLAYNSSSKHLFAGDLKSNAAQLFSVDLSASTPTVLNHKALLTKIGATEIADIAFAGDKQKGYLLITHKISEDNKVLTVLDSSKLNTPNTAQVKRFFEKVTERTGKLFVSPNQKMVLAVVQEPTTNKSQVRVIDTGIHVEKKGNHNHRHDDGVSLMSGTWDANANYFSPKQMYHSNQYIAALLQAKAFKSKKETQFSLLNDDIIKQLGKGTLSQPPVQQLPNLSDARVLVVSDKYLLASLAGDEGSDYAKNPTKVQLFEVAKKGGVLSLEAKQTFANQCPNIARTAQSESYSLFACENKILTIRNQRISK